MAVCVEAKPRCIKTQLWDEVTSQKGGRLWTDVRYWPSTQLEEKKQMLRVSRGFSWVNSGERVWGSDSPVREELSTSTGRRTERQRESERQSQWCWDNREGEVSESGWKWQMQYLLVPSAVLLHLGVHDPKPVPETLLQRRKSQTYYFCHCSGKLELVRSEVLTR